MTQSQIQSLGDFLSFYSTDLYYINQFQIFKTGKIDPNSYIEKKVGSFYSFLIEFRVIRNIPQGTINKILEETLFWVNSEDCDNVDFFAETLASKGLTRGVMTSMASKILFLNNPWKILPMDSLARKTLNQKQNNYATYKINLEYYIKENESTFTAMLNFTNPLITVIHKNFKELSDLEIISRNRIIDKLLWTSGK